MIDFSKVFHKTIAILKREGLWPDPDHVAPVDYALAQNYKIASIPAHWDIGFSVDFGGSEGIYIDITLTIKEEKAEPVIKSVGTIKTLTASRETLASYAALGANFVYFCRQEFQAALYSAFTNDHVYYEVFSLNTVDSFHPSAADPQHIKDNLKSYERSYALIDAGDFPVSMRTSPRRLCTYLLLRSHFEVGGYYPIEKTDILVCHFTYGKQDGQYAFICMDDNPENPLFEACKLETLKGGQEKL